MLLIRDHSHVSRVIFLYVLYLFGLLRNHEQTNNYDDEVSRCPVCQRIYDHQNLLIKFKRNHFEFEFFQMWAVCYRSKLVDPASTNNGVEGMNSQIKTNMGLTKKEKSTMDQAVRVSVCYTLL